jgi:hypothetical protein
MTNYISGLPFWLTALFIPIFVGTIAFIANPAKRAALDAGMSLRKATNIQVGIFVFYILYLGYVSVLALRGVFDVQALPPKAMVWGGFPLMIILFGFVGNTPLFKRLLRSASLESLVHLHVFRLAGVFFLLLYVYRLLPGAFAISAETGDILTALLAIPVSRMVAKGHRWSIPAVVAWNILGILDIVNALVIAVINPGQGNLREMTIFPFVWFPAFAPATILFLHTMVFRKLYLLKKASGPMGVPDIVR